MAPEHDARTEAFYDHESDDPSPRRRRAAADWGVNEDIFDRMPSRRFKRSDRRAEHRDEPDARRFERRVSGPAEPRRADEARGRADEAYGRADEAYGRADEAYGRADEWGEIRSRRDDWADEHERRQVAPRGGDWSAAGSRRAGGDRDAAAPRRTPTDDNTAPRRTPAGDYAAPRNAGDEYAEAASRFAAEYDDTPAARTPAEPRRPARRPAESWTDDIPAVQPDEGKRPVDSWLEPDPGKELELAPGESRTIVLEKAEPEPVFEDAHGRRTVTITGHPDRMPVPRAQRPPRSAIERIGASPDRIVGYAVLLGFVLVLIAVLTTNQ